MAGGMTWRRELAILVCAFALTGVLSFFVTGLLQARRTGERADNTVAADPVEERLLVTATGTGFTT